jgi:hypothetical protein
MIAISANPVVLYTCPIAATRIGSGRNAPKEKELTFDLIDTGYLEWMMDKMSDNEDLKHTCKTELRRRGLRV